MFDYVRSYTLLCLDILTKSIHISYRSVIKEFRAGFAIIVLLFKCSTKCIILYGNMDLDI